MGPSPVPVPVTVPVTAPTSVPAKTTASHVLPINLFLPVEPVVAEIETEEPFTDSISTMTTSTTTTTCTCPSSSQTTSSSDGVTTPDGCYCGPSDEEEEPTTDMPMMDERQLIVDEFDEEIV